MNPKETFNDPFGTVTLWHPNMVVGQTWADPLGTMQITLDSADENSAHLTIRPTPPVIISTATVPNIQFITAVDAQRALTAAHLVTGTVTTVQDTICDDADKVISQSPTAGKSLTWGGRVNFVVATPVPGSNCTGPPVGQ